MTAGLYQLFFIIFLVLAFFMGFVMTVSRFDFKTATTNSTNRFLNQYVELLETRTTRMLEVKGKVILDTQGFYRTLSKFSKRKRIELGPSESFYYFEKNISVQFVLQSTDDDGAVFGYEARWQDDSSGSKEVLADRGVFKMAWKF